VRGPAGSFRRCGLAVVAGAVLAGACGGGGVASPPQPQDPFSPGALAYGLPPLPHPEVTFQPEVVIVEGGGGAVRSVTADGLTWRLDPRAPGADRLEPDRVMFVTGRGVGRVLAVEPDGADLAVTIGPVEVTDVIRDGTFDLDGIVLDEPVVYPAGVPLWADLDALDEVVGEDPAPEPPGSGDEGAAPADPAVVVVAAHQLASPAPAPTVPTIPTVPTVPALPTVPRLPQPPPDRGGGGGAGSGPGSVFATCCTDGIGARFRFDDGSTRLAGQITLTFARPTARFHLDIRGGTVKRAELAVSGGFGTRYQFEAGTQGAPRTKPIVFPSSHDFSFPIAQVLGVPLTFTISQTLSITPAFGAKLGTIKGAGEFALSEELAFGYRDGSFGSRTQASFARKASLIDSLTGVPVGVMGLLVRHTVKFSVGFGAFVLNAGVYLELETSYGTTIGSALGAVGTLGSHFVQCRGVGLGVHATFGIGYSILRPVVDLINRFLTLIKVAPIRTTGGLRSRPVRVVAAQEVVPPDTQLCGSPGR
jgi:hypothetical protein